MFHFSANAKGASITGKYIQLLKCWKVFTYFSTLILFSFLLFFVVEKAKQYG